MNSPICRSLPIILLIAANAFDGTAQTSGKSTPSLSSDGVMTRRSANLIDEAGWTRYAPEGFGLSFELPGEAFERSYPIPPALQSRILESKVLEYHGISVSVNIANIVFKERVNLKWIAEQIQTSLSPKYQSDDLKCSKVSLVTKGDRLLLSASCLRFGNETEMQSLIIGSGEEAWLVSVQTLRENRDSDVVSQRVLNSAIIVR